MLEKELEGKHDETTQQAVHNAISRRKTRTHTKRFCNTRRQHETGGREKKRSNEQVDHVGYATCDGVVKKKLDANLQSKRKK